ncbi:hypothetical protein Nepgr_025388 [Nepenthes gracilis]|uniref:Aldehyde dehydrogenase domain-containing protein n=1 Tax=Nepenthes gracilis TaxID=150966 RepID=A0AAD3T5U2_NEPGR|nr:hypothetical protein Nepgr_025388 [Nepenthes gracilis]
MFIILPHFIVILGSYFGAVAASNVAVLKPSEIAPASSSLLAKFVLEYLDSSAIRVVEGGLPETTALLD